MPPVENTAVQTPIFSKVATASQAKAKATVKASSVATVTTPATQPKGSLRARVNAYLHRLREEAKAAKKPLPKLTKNSEIGYFAPKTWAFWRSVITSFCIFTIVGHWLEIPYCTFMDYFFGIVDSDYPVWSDPWYHPYWIYGIGAIIVTFLIEPVKEFIVLRRKTLLGAMAQTFVMVTIIAMLTELIMGWLVNQPDATGRYPFWDNSQLPLNVFGQAWLVNDMVIGFIAIAYVWVLYPLICEGFKKLSAKVSNKAANIAFGAIVIGFATCCTASYIQLALQALGA